MVATGPPVPGRAVRGSSTGRPLMAAMDLLGRRWALRILWELRHGPLGARALRDHCGGMSSSVLYDRLGELSAAGLIDQDASGNYGLTDHGASLGRALQPLDAWSQRWAENLRAGPGGRTPA
jgi:DNA-binding HxlR family transcriptional regulator